VRALCTADNHLGSGPDLGRTPGERLDEQEAVWRRTLELAREYECDVVLHGGDLFHKRRPTPEEVLAAVRPLREHQAEGGCRVLMCIGNHERSGTSEATMPTALSALDVLYVSHSPEPIGGGDVTICTLPWAPVSRIVAAQDGGDRDDVNAYAAELLLATARGLRAKADGPSILMTHFAVSGSSLPTGLPVDQLREPVLELAELEAIGFDAVVCGHIHKAQVFGDGVFYVGSPMPLNFGEAGYDHGCFLLEPDTLSGAYVPRFVPIESRRLVTLVYPDVKHEVEPPDITDAVVKVKYRATQDEARSLDVAALKRSLIEGGGAYKVASVQVEVERTERARVEGLTDELDEMAAFDLWLDSVGINGDRAAMLRERTQAYLGLVAA
jgi:exonuclease SbcD